MSLESSNALASLIARIAAGVTIEIEALKGTAHAVSITYEGKSLTFTFDQGGRVPDAADCISALWARAATLANGEEGFYRTFYEEAYEAAIGSEKKPMKKEYVEHCEEWKRDAVSAWRVFGDWFGRRWE